MKNKNEKNMDWEKEFYSKFTHDWSPEFYTKEEIKNLPKKVVKFIRNLLKAQEKKLRPDGEISFWYERGRKKERENMIKALKRLKLEFDVCVCDCGEPLKETDAANILKEIINQLKDL